MRTAIYPGTFDPVTLGHVDIAERGLRLFDRIVVAVADSRQKRPMFTLEERVAMFQEAVTQLRGVSVVPFDKLVVDFAREQGAKAIVKGLRAISDFEYELEMNQLNRSLASDVESIYLMASPQYSFLSSSGVKEIATFGGDVSGLVPEEVARRLQEALGR